MRSVVSKNYSSYTVTKEKLLGIRENEDRSLDWDRVEHTQIK